MNDIIKFRTYCFQDNNFYYSGGGGDLQQFIGIRDKKMEPIYEKDVVKGKYGLEGIEIIGEVKYNYDWCAYFIGDYEVSKIDIGSLEVVGNMNQNFSYNEKGELEEKRD